MKTRFHSDYKCFDSYTSTQKLVQLIDVAQVSNGARIFENFLLGYNLEPNLQLYHILILVK